LKPSVSNRKVAKGLRGNGRKLVGGVGTAPSVRHVELVKEKTKT